MYISQEDGDSKEGINSVKSAWSTSDNPAEEGSLMFHTPSFGEEDFAFLTEKVNREKEILPVPGLDINTSLSTSCYSTGALIPGQQLFGTSPQQSPLQSQSAVTFPASTAVLSLPVSYTSALSQATSYTFSQPYVRHSPAKMSTHRESILDSLQSIAPKFPPQNLDIPDISDTNCLGAPVTTANNLFTTGLSPATMYGQTSVPTTLGATVVPTEVTSTTSPPRESSEDSDDSVPLAQLVKRQAQDETGPTRPGPRSTAAKKARIPKKKKKKDPNEPQKPVSAYALFFRDTQAAIKGQNPNATFGEVSKIVASMWESLDPEHKNVYKKKTEMAKKEYLKQLAAYRASLVSQNALDDGSLSPSPPHRSPMGTSPQHLMGYNMNAGSPQHLGVTGMHMGASPAHMPSPQHITSPHQVSSPQHIISSPQHVTSTMSSPHTMSPQHALSPQHVTSPHHNISPQHAVSPQHALSPNHAMTMQQPMFDYSKVPQNQSGHYGNMGGYSNGPINDNNGHGGQQHLQATIMPSGRGVPSGMCIRSGCHNRAIDNVGWDTEYCSNECVVSHCRDVFTAWVANRQVPNSYNAVK